MSGLRDNSACGYAPDLQSRAKDRRKLAALRWQAKQKAAGRCVTCGSPRKKGNKWHCARHAAASAKLHREWRLRHLEEERARGRWDQARRLRQRKAEWAAARG